MLKPSLASVGEPFLHLVGDRLRRADNGEAGIAAEPLRQLAHGEVFPRRHRDDAVARALAGVALGDFRQRLVGIEARRIVPERDRQRGDALS